MKEKSNELVISIGKKNNAEDLVIEEMKNPKWLYRSVNGIVKRTKLSESEVSKVLQNSNKIRKSVIPSSDGSNLYVLKERKSLIGDLWTAFNALNYDKNNS